MSGLGERRRKKLAVLHRRQGGLCALCGKPLKLADADLDHDIPRVRGGPSALWNLQATHRTCNNAKGAQISPAMALVTRPVEGARR